MAEKPTPPCSLSHTSEGLVFTGSGLTYRITGLAAHNLDRLFVTLKASAADAPALFHIDKLDLYNSRAREVFAALPPDHQFREDFGRLHLSRIHPHDDSER